MKIFKWEMGVNKKSNSKQALLLAGALAASGLGYSANIMAKNSFLIAPGRLEIDLAQPKTVSYIVTNNGDGKIRLSVKPVYFPVNSRSLAAGEPLDPATTMDDDIHKLIRISPRKLSLRPGQRRDIRVSIRPRPNMKHGDYRAHLLVSMEETAQELGNKGKGDGKSSVGMKLSLKMETAVAIYGTLGKKQPELKFECLQDKNKNVVLAASNISPWRFDGWLRVYRKKTGAKGKPLAKIRLNSVRMSKRYVHSKWKPKGTGPYIITWADLNSDKPWGKSSCSISGKYKPRI